MTLPYVLDNDRHKLADALDELLAASAGRPVDVATAYFNLGGFRLVRERLPHVGAFRLLLGAEPKAGADVGLKPAAATLRGNLVGDLAAEPFTEETLRLVEDLIRFLRTDKTEVRLYERGFLHAKAYLFHQDRVDARNRRDRLQPFAGIVGSSNFTGPGLATNRELNVVHRVLLPEDPATDADAARRLAYLGGGPAPELPDDTRRIIKSEVGARAIADLTAWFERQWEDAADFKEQLVELLDASKFGAKEYTPYQVYAKALYEYFKDELGDDAAALGRSAVDLAEFQEDSVRKARRILARYDGVLIADSVGLGKTWIGKKLLEDFAYHRRQKAVVVCPASLRAMWQRELAAATVAAQVVGMEELGRDGFDATPYADADVVLIDESHNFRNDKANRYLSLDALIQRHGGRGRDGDRKKVILLSATPINNDLYDLANQMRLFTQGRADYFREAGIGDLNGYFRRARRKVHGDDTPAGVALFNLLEEVMVRNTRPYIRAAYPHATVRGQPVVFPERRLHTVEYSLGAKAATLYRDIVAAIDGLSLAPYKVEFYRKKQTVADADKQNWAEVREEGLVGIFKVRFLKRLESSVAAFRLSLRRALAFEETYRAYLLGGKIVSSRDFHRALRFLERDGDDEETVGSRADEIDADADAKAYIDSLPTVSTDEFRLRDLDRDVAKDVAALRSLYDRTEELACTDGKLARLKDLLRGELRGQKVLVFSTFRDTSRYLHRALAEDPDFLAAAGNPHIRRIDSGNHPSERTQIVASFAPEADAPAPEREIDVLISTDVLSEGQNLQACGRLINYDLTWNPIRLVQRNGRIDRIGSPHAEIGIYNLFPERALEDLLKLVERLSKRLRAIDDLGLLDSSVLGETVHPRTFNTLRRIRAEDGAVLDEEEGRAELAGPELLLKQLKDLLHRDGENAIAELPNGIHSGLRRTNADGMFFYFRAPRSSGDGKRHFWRYIDARTHTVAENRFEIAGLVACLPDEPRYPGGQDVFALQERVIDHILSADREAAARGAAAASVEPIQRVIAETIKNALRARTVDRAAGTACVSFLGQPTGRGVQALLKQADAMWRNSKDDVALISEVHRIAAEYRKTNDAPQAVATLTRADLELVCFEYVSG